jgi:short-subunit dehydrogenase
MAENILIVGATSGIARALSARLAARGCRLILAGRDMEELEACAADLRIRFGAIVIVEEFDARVSEGYSNFWQRCLTDSGENAIDGVVFCVGMLPEQSKAQSETSLLQHSFHINLFSAAAILEIAAEYFQTRRAGFLAAISSVAGDRGRQSNYIYGSAKAGLSAYLQGLRNRLHPYGVHVLSIKPGIVATRMTAGMMNPDSPIMATPARVARDIDRAIRRRQDVLYTPGFWRPIMSFICAIPEMLFKRLKF